jgi:exodeoxyribonuclease-3
MTTLRVLTLNVASPSIARAEQQLAWLADRDEHVHVLTELSTGKGSELLVAGLHQAGWDVRSLGLETGERGVLIAARVRVEDSANAGAFVDFLPHRAISASLPDGLQILGVYVPSRDESPAGIRRKREFLASLARALSTGVASRGAVLIGDLNILEPEHRPRYGSFQDWEYAFYRDLVGSGWNDAYRLRHPTAMDHSWVGLHDDGYRFDHAFVTTGLGAHVVRCDYVHETRALGLSDHSAMTVAIDGVDTQSLDVASSLSSGPASLF